MFINGLIFFDPSNQSLQVDTGHRLLTSVHFLYTKYVSAEVKCFETMCLVEEGDQCTSRPYETLAECFFNADFVLAQWFAVDELDGAP